MGQEARELVHQDVLDLVGLLDLDADADRVDGGLDQDALVLVARNGQRRQEDLGGRLGLDLGDIVSLGRLGGEVGERQRGSQTASYALQVRPQGLRLQARGSVAFSDKLSSGFRGRTMAAEAVPSLGCYRCSSIELRGLGMLAGLELYA